MKRVHLAMIAAFALGAAACGKPFDVKAAPGFVPLDNQELLGTYAWRATTPEGVVTAVRVIEDEDRGDLGFWTQALVLQLRDATGYALLENVETTSLDGTKGRLLKFGHDEADKPYVYWLAIFAAQDRLFVFEAGGANDAFERARPGVEWTMKSLRVRCDSLVAPVLASHTCNRW